MKFEQEILDWQGVNFVCTRYCDETKGIHCWQLRRYRNSVHMLELLTVGVSISRGALLYVVQLFSFVKPWELPEVHLHQPRMAT